MNWNAGSMAAFRRAEQRRRRGGGGDRRPADVLTWTKG
jgi:hypothetical protein